MCCNYNKRKGRKRLYQDVEVKESEADRLSGVSD